ncbi:MAG TPA: hypothetical protein VHU92_12460, partial [Streptosporangiaceae bacterium]|nr:hypothetical protein [Streptosporangiaceae bacterium]
DGGGGPHRGADDPGPRLLQPRLSPVGAHEHVHAAGHDVVQLRTGPLGLASAFRGTFWWCLAFTALALGPALLLNGSVRRTARRRP